VIVPPPHRTAETFAEHLRALLQGVFNEQAPQKVFHPPVKILHVLGVHQLAKGQLPPRPVQAALAQKKAQRLQRLAAGGTGLLGLVRLM
jgi:hypothetical protein